MPARLRALLAVLLLAACGRTPPSEDRATLLRDVHTVVGDSVRDAVRISGADSGAATVAALAVQPGQVTAARWLVLLGGGPGRWRLRARIHTYLPVEDVPGRFGAADVDGDGKQEVFALGTSYGIGGPALEVVVLRPDGEVFRYEGSSGLGHDDLEGVWTPNLERHPAILAWMAAAAHRTLPVVRRQADSAGMFQAIAGDTVPPTPDEALEAARQRLGWGVKEVISLGHARAQANDIAVLYGSDAEERADRVAFLYGSYGVYSIGHEITGIYGERIADHAGDFGSVDVDRDGIPEIWEFNDASGTGGWAAGAAVLDIETGRSYEGYVSQVGVPEAGTYAVSFGEHLNEKPGAQAFLDSLLRLRAVRDYGARGPLPAEWTAAARAEEAWESANGQDVDSIFARAPLMLPAVRGGVPGVGAASCVLRDGGVEWVSRPGGGLWMHDLARDSSYVVLATGSWPVTSLVAGARYLWTNLATGDSAAARALVAFDRRARRLVRVPARELARAVQPRGFFVAEGGREARFMGTPACRGWCETGAPLHASDGALVLDDTWLTLPAWVASTGELAHAKPCVRAP